MALDKFVKLEERLNQILESFELIQNENKGLKASTDIKDQEIAALKERISKLDSEKNLVKDKVDALLEKIDTLIQGA